jgi:Zn finger protein HypA/HybF involved in hydrogenase expression
MRKCESCEKQWAEHSLRNPQKKNCPFCSSKKVSVWDEQKKVWK